MFVRSFEDRQAAGMVKSLVNNTTQSARFLTAADGLGFSYNENRIGNGSDVNLWYKHHWEANYIVSGKGEVTDLTSGQKWALGPGVLYVVGPNDRHRFHIAAATPSATSASSVPPLKGDERHDADGAYAASGPVPEDEPAHVREARGRDARGGQGAGGRQRQGAHHPHADPGGQRGLQPLGRASRRRRRGACSGTSTIGRRTTSSPAPPR